MSSINQILFACSRCYSRHPFEELSPGQQLCKECRGAFPVVKCTYCRSEFQQTSKQSTTSICKKCEANVKSYGKPSPCEYCNIIAAFIGNKCQRCTNSEKKYGPPVTCEQCKQKCAFDRKDEDKKVDGKLLCWLCTLSYKRALAKTKSTDPTRHSHVKLGNSNSIKKEQKKAYDKRPQRVDVTKLEQPPSKKAHHEKFEQRTQASSSNNQSTNATSNNTNNSTAGVDLDGHNCSDHVVALTQLREQIASLNRQVNQRDQQLLAKDRQITELRASNFTTESELRNKLKDAQRDFEGKVQQMTLKMKTLQKDLAKKEKTSKNKSSLTIVSSRSNNNNIKKSTPSPELINDDINNFSD